MASTVEISIPNSSSSNTVKPYTLYNISLRLPLRSLTVQKRYSDFTTLHEALKTQVGNPPPASLPQKSWFSKTTSNPDLAEERRRGLETYLQTINQHEDSRWRNTSAWRTFLNLPSTTSSKSSLLSGLHNAVAGSGSSTPITDPIVWLDHHRLLKTQLHDARLHLTKRDQASTAQAQHESGAQAKKALVRAGTTLTSLEEGLKNLGAGAWGSEKLGEGEIRRRRDLLGSARREKEGLENLLSAMITKSQVDETVASAQQKQDLIGSPSNHPSHSAGGGGGGGVGGGRVLGRETAKTRALDNQGVLQLQQQMMHEQDEDVEILAQAVRRQRELGSAIHDELLVQNELLGLLDEDVGRVQGKIEVAKKRIGKIS